MKYTNIFGGTIRENQKEAEVVSHNLLLRAGYIKQIASGIYSYLHFGQKSLKKIEQILREEMNEIGGDEICMPFVHPAEIWKKTNRWSDIDNSLVRFKDRNDRDMVLAMTHEEIVGFLASAEIKTYKQLPKLVYQIFNKFRDELRSRGGLIRVREFVMKDSYSLDTDIEGMERQYFKHYNTYYRIFERVGLPSIAVLSDTGMMGGNMAHEFIYVTPIGEDTIFISSDNKYRANKEVATIRKFFKSEEPRDQESVLTPGKSSIPELTEFLNIEKSSIAKLVFYAGEVDDENKIIIAVVPGDFEASPMKISKIIGVKDLKTAKKSQIISINAQPGYASPIGIDRTKSIVIVDDIIAKSNNLVYGSNKQNYHEKNVCYGRDYTADFVGDIVSAHDGALAPHTDDDSIKIKSVKGIEIGNIFQLGTKYSEALGAYFVDEKGNHKPVVMGSYGIGVGRLLACLCEEHNDENGLRLPITVAPYEVILVGIFNDPEIETITSKMYNNLKKEGIDILYDDRDNKTVSAGAKFRDADLIGIPIRVTVSKKSLSMGGVEVKMRNESTKEIVAEKDCTQFLKNKIDVLNQQIWNKVNHAETW